jgi:membrane protein
MLSQLNRNFGRLGQRLNGLRERAERNGFVVLLERTALGFGLHDLSGSAGSVAYFALLSIFPLLLALVAVFGFLIGTEAARERILAILIPLLPVSSDVIVQNVDAAIKARGVIGVVSLVILLWSSLGIFSSITVAVNRAWGIREGRPFLQQTLLNLAMIATIGVVLVLSLLVTALAQLVAQFGVQFPGPQALTGNPLLSVLAGLLSLALSFGVFLAVYKVLPATKVKLSDVWLPALIGALLFEIAKSLFSWYIARFTNYSLVFGSLAAIVVLLFWIYISALLLLFGAELAAQYAAMKGDAPAAGLIAAEEPVVTIETLPRSTSETSHQAPAMAGRFSRFSVASFLAALLALVALVATVGRRAR